MNENEITFLQKNNQLSKFKHGHKHKKAALITTIILYTVNEPLQFANKKALLFVSALHWMRVCGKRKNMYSRQNFLTLPRSTRSLVILLRVKWKSRFVRLTLDAL